MQNERGSGKSHYTENGHRVGSISKRGDYSHTQYDLLYEARFLDLISGRKIERVNRRMKERKGRLIKASYHISD